MRLLLLVVAWHYQLVYLLAERSPQERDDLRAGAVIARRKRCLAHARGHAVHVAPRQTLSVPKVVSVRPVTMPVLAAQRTASA